MLDRSLIIQKQSTSKNAFGELITTWSDLKSIPATIVENYRGVSNKEVYESNRESSLRELVFRIRYKDWLNSAEYRVKFQNRVFDISEVREDLDNFRRQYMLVICDSRNQEV